MPRKTFTKIKLRQDVLHKYGYHNVVHMNAQKRQLALLKSMLSEGVTPVMRRLVVLRTFNKNKNPRFARKLDADIKWIQKNMYENVYA